MADIADIMEALFARVESLDSGSPDLPIAWPEQAAAFVPPADGRYLAVSFFSNAPRWSGVASGRLDQGLLQVSVIWPRNLGLLVPGAIADLIIAHFPLGLRLINGSARVTVAQQPWAASPLSEPDRLTIPVTIPWTA